MSRILIALVILTFALSACEPSTNDNSNSAKSTPTTVATPAPTSTPSPEASVTVKPVFRAGDKVTIKKDGSSVEAAIVSVDEKAAKAVVRVSGEKQDRTVDLASIVKP